MSFWLFSRQPIETLLVDAIIYKSTLAWISWEARRIEQIIGSAASRCAAKSPFPQPDPFALPLNFNKSQRKKLSGQVIELWEWNCYSRFHYQRWLIIEQADFCVIANKIISTAPRCPKNKTVGNRKTCGIWLEAILEVGLQNDDAIYFVTRFSNSVF